MQQAVLRVCFVFSLLVNTLLTQEPTASPISGSKPDVIRVCPNGVPLPVAAYYLNREKDTVRAKFMEEKLAQAHLEAIRVPAWNGFDIRERLLHGDTSSALAQVVRSQTRCSNVLKHSSSPLGCFSKMVQSGNCTHVTAYGVPTHSSKTRGRRQCSGYIANYMGKLRAISRILHDVFAAKYGKYGAFVILLEDDTSPVADWRSSYCEFVRAQPPFSWDVAKVDSTRARNVMHTLSLAIKKHVIKKKSQAKNFVYSTNKLVAMRSNPSKYRNVTDQRNVAFGWGAATLLFHTSYANRLYSLFDMFPIGSVDLHMLMLHSHGLYRLAMSDKLVFDSGHNDLQGTSSIEGITLLDNDSSEAPDLTEDIKPPALKAATLTKHALKLKLTKKANLEAIRARARAAKMNKP